MSSKIKVDTIENVAGSGNVSLGSGHNLVVPGNITGQGTAAITSNATVGGTLGVTSNATVSGTLGVGSTNTPTSSSGGKLIAIETTADEHTNLVFNTANTARNGIIEGRRTGRSGSERFAQINIQNNSDNGEIRFYTAASGSDVSEKMKIDASGNVTKPLTPFVRLQLTSHISPNTSVSSPGNQITGFTVKENVGSYWNSSNNNFTCPVAGVYSVSIFWIKYPGSGHAHVDLHKNGSHVDAIRWRAPEVSAGYHQAGGTASVTCAANDVLDWHYFGSAGVHDGNGSWEIMLSH